MPELFATLEAMREQAHKEHKFVAGLQGIDLDGDNSPQDEGQKKFAEMRAKVMSGGKVNANDIKLRSAGMAHKAVSDDDGIEWWKM